jgi:hypothetical protein
MSNVAIIGKTPSQKEKEILEKIVEIAILSSHMCYKYSKIEIKEANPNLENLAEICRELSSIIGSRSHINGKASEVIEVLEYAASVLDDVAESDLDLDAHLTDCAYHLDDFIDRNRS